MIRFFDLIFSILAIVITLPLFLIIIILLRFTGEGEIFFLQDRIGKNYKKFKLIKFATMIKNSPNIGSRTITMSNDPRVLPLGKFLRKTKLNELPQILNIIKNDMSLIGPRPLTLELFNKYSINIRKQIVKTKPGLSGLGSVIFRSEEQMLKKTKNVQLFYKKIILPYKGELELWFLKNNNLLIYFYLIFLTIVLVISPKSIFLKFFMKYIPAPPKELSIYFK